MNRTPTLTRRRNGAVAVAVALALAACGDGSGSGQPDPAAAASKLPSPGSNAPSQAAAGVAGSDTQPVLAGGTAKMSGKGVDAGTITVGQVATTSGPVPGLLQASVDGMDAFAAYINSQGGINGRRLVVKHKDDALDCVTHGNVVKELAAESFALVGTFSPLDGCAETVLRANPGVANIEGDMLTPSLFALPNTYAAMTRPPGYFTTGYQYVKDRFGEEAIKKVGVLYPSSGQAAHKGNDNAAQSVGYKYVYERGLGEAETNFTADILRMKSSGVQIVDLTMPATNVVAKFLQQAAQQNYKPKAVIAPAGYDAKLFELVGNADAVAPLVAPLFFPLFLGEDRASNPALDTYLTWLKKTKPQAAPTYPGVAAWAAGVMFAQAAQTAGKSGEVTQESIAKAVKELGPFTAGGLLPATDAGKRTGPKCVAIVGAKDGKFVRLEPAKGYECNGTYVMPGSA